MLEVQSIRDAPAGPAEPGTVELVAEVRVAGYRGEPDSDPSVERAGDGWVQTVLVALVDGERGWRLARVEPAAGATASPGPEQQEPARQDPRG
ncbi:hypothetical protein ACH9D2_08250 [Kocuria sp. M4R2S49]|uniref:hypothetical protein n=1 Tax=Kocuria rhizosphaericola TaxID=3376284 RepID=UPI003790CA7B